MRVSVITPPARAVSLADARVFLGSAGTDALLDMLLIAAQAEIEPPENPWGRAFGAQTLEMAFGAEEWRCRQLKLWYPPIVSVSSVHYIDADGVEQELAPAAWLQDGESVVPAIGASWPDVACRAEAARVVYVAGSATIPEPVKLAIVMSAQHLLAFGREDIFVKKEVTEGVGSTEWEMTDAASAIIRQTVDRLLGRYRLSPGV